MTAERERQKETAGLGSVRVTVVTQAFSFLRVFSQQTAAHQNDAAAGETDCSQSKLDYSLGLVSENKMSFLSGRFLSERSGEEEQGRCVEIDAAVELIKKLH